MALYGALDSTKHLAEFTVPLFSPTGVMSPADRQSACLANLGISAIALLSSGGGVQAFTDRVTVADGVSGGTAKVVGGRAFTAVSANDDVLATVSNGNHVDFAQTYSIPAGTLKLGTVLRVNGFVRVTDASGTVTLETRLHLGGTVLLTTTAFDPADTTDFARFEYELVSRSAPSGASPIVGTGWWATEAGSTQASACANLAPTNFATNAALVLKASAKWSASQANTNARLETFTVDIL